MGQQYSFSFFNTIKKADLRGRKEKLKEKKK
jgi:hypothetical protein